MSRWKPIETAPKGQKLLLGYRNGHGKWRTITGRYFLPGTLEATDSLDESLIDENGCAPEGWYEESETHDELLPCLQPTHWMPLPDAPTPDDRSLDDDCSEPLPAQKPLPPGDVEALREALEALDRVDKECPVRRSSSAVERCPSCRATSNDGCGMAALAGGRVIEASRLALAALSASPGGSGEGLSSCSASPGVGENVQLDPVGAAEREVGRFIYKLIEARMDARAGTAEGRELVYLARIVSDVEEYGADELAVDAIAAEPAPEFAAPIKHRYWRPGEPDCPRDIKAPNGELHTLRCKVCGVDDPLDEFCALSAAVSPPVQPPLHEPLPPPPVGEKGSEKWPDRAPEPSPDLSEGES